MSLQAAKNCIALKDTVNGWKALHLYAALLFSANIIVLQLHFHITVAHHFLYTEQHHRPSTPNALEFPSGSLPIDHTDMSQAMLKQKINFPSPSVRTAYESHLQSKQGLNMKWINKVHSTFHVTPLLAYCATYNSITAHCSESNVCVPLCLCVVGMEHTLRAST